MKFRVADLNFKPSQQYPYSHRVELFNYTVEEQDTLMRWLKECNINCWVGDHTLYVSPESLSLFLLKWT